MPVFPSLTYTMHTAQDLRGAVQNQTHCASPDSGGFLLLKLFKMVTSNAICAAAEGQ